MAIHKSELVAVTRQRLSDPQRWTKGVAARDDKGHSTAPDSSAAVAWCLTGAMRREMDLRGQSYHSQIVKEVERAIVKAFQEQFPQFATMRFITTWNDHSQVAHDDVLRALEKVHTQLVERGE